MCKKISLGVLGLALIAGLLFGGRLLPYAQTAYQNIQDAADDRVPIDFKIDAAKTQLNKVTNDIQDMVYEIAKEQVQVKRLAADLQRQEDMLQESYDEMMTLREHLETSDQYYVATNNQKYSRERVEEDLRHRFSLYKTAEATKNKQAEILRVRKTSLQSAWTKLDQTKAQQRELEFQIENLTARNRMNEVIASANQLELDSSNISATKQMVDELDAKISAQEEVLNIAPKYYGQIPVNEDVQAQDSNILDDMDTYFKKSQDDQGQDDIDFETEI
ncbi:MAG: hypothetical protein AAFN77_07775 [Planctomycetota bacterium]